MSILANKDTRVVIQGGQAGVNAARRMAEFCYLIKRPLNVEAFVYPPDAGKTNEIPYGSGLIAIPIYKSIAEATKHHLDDQHQPRLHRCRSGDEGRHGSARRFAHQGGLDDHRRVCPRRMRRFLAPMRESSVRCSTGRRPSASSRQGLAAWA